MRTAAKEAVIITQEAIQTARSQVGVYESKVQSAKVAVETAVAKADMARLAMEKAEIQLGFATLRANLDGIVIGRHVNSGDFVSASDPGGRRALLTVMRTDPVRVVVEAADRDVPFIRPGVAVHLHIDSLPDVKLPDCKVSRTGFALDENTGTMPVEIDVPNPGNRLRPGMFISATISLDKKAAADAVTVPASAVLFPPKGPHRNAIKIRAL
jgi:RND family efflux transporter MFP subunit